MVPQPFIPIVATEGGLFSLHIFYFSSNSTFFALGQISIAVIYWKWFQIAPGFMARCANKLVAWFLSLRLIFLDLARPQSKS